MQTRPGCPSQDEEFYFIDPHSIEIGGESGSGGPPPEEVIAMAASLHLHGQRRPVECQRLGDARLLLVHGRVRVAGARLLREGFEYTDPKSNERLKIRDKKFKVWVTISGDEMKIEGTASQ